MKSAKRKFIAELEQSLLTKTQQECNPVAELRLTKVRLYDDLSVTQVFTPLAVFAMDRGAVWLRTLCCRESFIQHPEAFEAEVKAQGFQPGFEVPPQDPFAYCFECKMRTDFLYQDKSCFLWEAHSFEQIMPQWLQLEPLTSLLGVKILHESLKAMLKEVEERRLP